MFCCDILIVFLNKHPTPTHIFFFGAVFILKFLQNSSRRVLPWAATATRQPVINRPRWRRWWLSRSEHWPRWQSCCWWLCLCKNCWLVIFPFVTLYFYKNKAKLIYKTTQKFKFKVKNIKTNKWKTFLKTTYCHVKL